MPRLKSDQTMLINKMLNTRGIKGDQWLDYRRVFRQALADGKVSVYDIREMTRAQFDAKYAELTSN